MKGRRLALFFPFLFIISCSSKKTSPDAEKSQSAGTQATAESPSEAKMPELPGHEEKRLVPLAFGPDGFPKIKKIFKGTTKDSPIERMEYDFNGDGRMDFIKYQDPSGTLTVAESADLDGDGNFDVKTTYEKNSQGLMELRLQEYDTHFSGRPGLWKHYANGKLVRREIDRRSSGKPDYWEYYENAKLVLVEKDENGDGSPDTRPRFKPIVKPRAKSPLR